MAKRKLLTIDKKTLDVARDAWLELGDTSTLQVENPLVDLDEFWLDNLDLLLYKVMKDPKNLWFTCKYLFNVELHPMQVTVLQEIWRHPFPMLIGSRGFSKSFLLALYSMIIAVFVPGSKIVIVGAAFRQAKMMFEYCEAIYKNAPVLQSICKRNDGPRRDVDRVTLYILDSTITGIPIGSGEKIRGMRAHIIIADEFNSLRPDIYETVIAGFAVVSQSPIDNIKANARRDYLKSVGQWDDELEAEFNERKSNQAILSGTAGFDFQHFAAYWKRYRSIILSKGDPNKLADLLGTEADIDIDNLNWKDYCILRIPYALVPKGFMDNKHVARAKATVHFGTYLCEYAGVFAKDSDGFFKRSLIDSCVGTDLKPVQTIDGPVWFDCMTRGNNAHQYVMAIDPASQTDNFCIVILELHPTHTRVVYCWTITSKKHKKRLTAGLTTDHNFFSYCAKKVYELVGLFPVVHISIDTQGGGYSLVEAIGDPLNIPNGVLPLYPIPDERKPLYTDMLQGNHIIEYIQFASADWVNQANNSLLKDMQDKMLLFPRFDSAGLAIAIENGGRNPTNLENTEDLYDSLEEVMLEIEEMKNELTTIVHTKSPQGQRDRWDTPDLKMANGKKGKMVKDRYTALLMANYASHSIQRTPPAQQYSITGGLSHQIDPRSFTGQPMYSGPDWFTSKANSCNFRSVGKKPRD